MVSLGQVIALIKAMGGSGGGSSLPSVSSTDNGDVLTVVNGAWDKAAPSGLPAVTSSDIGKSMMVQRGAAPVGAVVVPQQTATYDQMVMAYPLSNVDTDLFTDGRCIQVTYGEETEIGYISASGPDFYCDLVGGSIGYYSDAGGWYFWFCGDNPPASLAISANEVNYAANWGKAYPYDMGVTIDPVNETATLDFGTYDDVYSKLLEGRPVSISVANVSLERYSPVAIFIDDPYIVARYIWKGDNGEAKFSDVKIASDGTVTAR